MGGADMTTSNSHRDEMAMLAALERLRQRIDAGTASRAEEARYARLVAALDRRLEVTGRETSETRRAAA